MAHAFPLSAPSLQPLKGSTWWQRSTYRVFARLLLCLLPHLLIQVTQMGSPLMIRGATSCTSMIVRPTVFRWTRSTTRLDSFLRHHLFGAFDNGFAIRRTLARTDIASSGEKLILMQGLSEGHQINLICQLLEMIRGTLVRLRPDESVVLR